jgi:hypothetical protein
VTPSGTLNNSTEYCRSDGGTRVVDAWKVTYMVPLENVGVAQTHMGAQVVRSLRSGCDRKSW